MIDWARVIASFSVGVIYALAGISIQSYTRNDLAGPSTLGIQAFVVLIVMGSGLLQLVMPSLPTTLFSYIGLFVFLFLFLFYMGQMRSLQGNRFEQNSDMIVFGGLCFNLFAGALFLILQFIFMAIGQYFPSQIWFGSFKFATMEKAIGIFLCALFYYGQHGRLSQYCDLSRFGPEVLLNFGPKGKKTMLGLVGLCLFGIGVITIEFGVFSFVGIIFPHILRRIKLFQRKAFCEMRYGAPACGLIMCALDQVCYFLPIRGLEMPVGLLTGPIGTGILLFFLIKECKRSIAKMDRL